MSWQDILKDDAKWGRIHQHLRDKLQEYKRDYPSANTLSFNKFDEIYEDIIQAAIEDEERLQNLAKYAGFSHFNPQHQGKSDVVAFYY
jgi:hypothetical protein